MTKAVAILAVLTSSMATQTTARADRLPHKPFSTMTIAQISSYQKRVIAYDQWVIRTRVVHEPYVVWWHRQQLKWTTRELKKTLARLRPVTNHQSGWLCIHSREGSWTDGGGPYYGGLQMSYGWMGVVTYANLLSPSAQMALAERVASQHGFSHSWMSGQWPNTYPPCAGYF